jgi:hypothetical protein
MQETCHFLYPKINFLRGLIVPPSLTSEAILGQTAYCVFQAKLANNSDQIETEKECVQSHILIAHYTHFVLKLFQEIQELGRCRVTFLFYS